VELDPRVLVVEHLSAVAHMVVERLVPDRAAGQERKESRGGCNAFHDA